MDFSTLLTVDNMVKALMFIAKPLLLLILCKIVINILLKLVDGVFAKAHLDKGIKTFTKSVVRIGAWVLAIIIIASSVGVDTASLVAMMSVASLALSLSVQGIFTNLFSGIVILVTKPFSVGDYVDVAGVSGTVTSINLMRTTLNTVDNKVELVPNGDIAVQKITNYSIEKFRRVDLKVNTKYDVPTYKVKETLAKLIESDDRIMKDDEKSPSVRISDYTKYGVEYTIKLWVENGEYWNVYFDFLEEIREHFDSEGIEFARESIIVENK